MCGGITLHNVLMGIIKLRQLRKLKRMGEHLKHLRSILKAYDDGYILTGWITIHGRGNPVRCLGRFDLVLHIARTKENIRKVMNETGRD